jgi:hypothetical protein
MDVIRSNFSTLSPHAQKEAPSAPEYPYTQIMAAYRGALEAVEHFEDNDSEPFEKQSDGNGIGSGRNHTKAFQRILNHFFGDYFKEDADEEMASDMSERWASFSRRSNPNYDGSKADWLPWRHKSANSTFFSSDDSMYSDEDSWDDDWTDTDDWTDEYDSEDEMLGDYVSMDEFYRNKALEFMQMDVVVEDMFRTELKRVQYRKEDEDEESSFLKGKVWKRWYQQQERQFAPMAKMRANEARRLAQELGVMGIGLSEDRNGRGVVPPKEIYFPELLELTWPPEVSDMTHFNYSSYQIMIA